MDTISWKTFCIGGTIVCGLAYTLLGKKITKAQKETTLNEVLLYGANKEKGTQEVGLDNLICIYYVLAHATRTVDVCLPSLHSETIGKCLINLQKKNKTRIRVAIHNSSQLDNLKTLAEHCIETKVVSSQERLEHEFILIDACEGFNDALALIGSLDYDTARVNCNRDSTMLISERTVVVNLKMEFERIWNNTTTDPKE